MPKGTILDYLVVRDNDHEDFSRKVLEKLQDGYTCRGKMQTQRAGTYTFDYIQNMVKRAPAPQR